MNRFIIILLLIGCASSSDTNPIPKKNIYVVCSDGFQLAGWYVPPRNPQDPVWILLHGLGAGKNEWEPFTVSVQARGHGWLAYDARGHGNSTRQGKVSYKEFRFNDWQQLIGDLGAVVSTLLEQEDITTDQIRLAGASLGANIVARYAAPRISLSSIVMLSPGLNYAGIQTQDAIQEFGGRRVFMAVAEGDRYSYQSVEVLEPLAKKARGKVVAIRQKGKGHGVNLLDEKLVRKLIQWAER